MCERKKANDEASKGPTYKRSNTEDMLKRGKSPCVWSVDTFLANSSTSDVKSWN